MAPGRLHRDRLRRQARPQGSSGLRPRSTRRLSPCAWPKSARRLRLDPRTVIIVDEVSTLSDADLRALVEAADSGVRAPHSW